ncbi:MAG TPA: branched-chain amino acid ABC transporter ATP-binding protein/permease [Acetobacteraceae bacterium]|nr:branched-chain amino acid ABC transporter ATP-binding protein/permease [Acetobacteraceae bacterium]
MIKQALKFLPFPLILAIIPFLLPGGRLGSYYLTLMILSVSYAVAALGLTVLLGYSGQVSLAQAAFFGIGSYVFAILAVKYHQYYWEAFILSLVVTVAFGFILGVISLRLASHYLALVTIGFQIIVELVLNNWSSFTGGADGISNIPRPVLFGFDFVSDHAFYWLSLGFLVLASYIVYRVRHSRVGSALLALREDEIAASAAGISVFHAKTLAFTISAGLGALGGILYASGSLYISPNVYSFNQSVSFFAMVLVGGQESIIGTTLGAALITFLPEVLRFLHAYYIAVYGLLVVIVILFMPEGLYGMLLRILDALLGLVWKRGPAGTVVPVATLPEHRKRRPQASNELVLQVKGLHKHFGGVKAVNGVDFTICKGDIAVLIGPNGSGKTTVLNVLSGIYSATKGEILYKGANIANRSPNRINRLGISRTFQNIRLFPELTALENVVIGYFPKGKVGLAGALFSRPRGYQEERLAREQARKTLELLGFTRFDEKAKNLPYGQQRIVEIARAIVCEPELLLLDEPAAGMNREETEALSEILYRIHDLGLTVLLIEHDMSFVSSVATRAYVMDFGQKISEGSVQKVLSDPEVIKAYLGDDAAYA